MTVIGDTDFVSKVWRDWLEEKHAEDFSAIDFETKYYPIFYSNVPRHWPVAIEFEQWLSTYGVEIIREVTNYEKKCYFSVTCPILATGFLLKFA